MSHNLFETHLQDDDDPVIQSNVKEDCFHCKNASISYGKTCMYRIFCTKKEKFALNKERNCFKNEKE